MRIKWSVGALTACVVAGAGYLGYHQLWNSPAREANHLAELVRDRKWKVLYAVPRNAPFSGAWSAETFEAFAKKYIEPKGGEVVVNTESAGINGLKAYQILMKGKNPGDPAAFSEYYMPFSKLGSYHVVGSKEVSTNWDYSFALDDRSTLEIAAHAWFPSAAKGRNGNDDPALYEFLLKEGDNLRAIGCEHFYPGSKKDDIASSIESIEQHARLDKTALNLVPIAAKYGRKMKFPPTDAELAMK